MESREVVKEFLKLIQEEAELSITRNIEPEQFEKHNVILILGRDKRANSWLINNLRLKNKGITLFIFGDTEHKYEDVYFIEPEDVPGFEGWNTYCTEKKIDDIIFFNPQLYSLDAYYTEEVVANITCGIKQFVFISESYELCSICAKEHLKTVVLYNDIINWFSESLLLKREIENTKVDMMTQKVRVIGNSEYIEQALKTIRDELKK